MNLSLQARVAIVITLIIVAISSISTFVFISAYSGSRERNRIMRGETLAYTLGKSAEEGLLKEDLNLLRKAAHVIQAPDVTRVQVFSTIWNCIDAYPFDRLSDAPLPEAVSHFKSAAAPVFYRMDDSFDFYEPILFQPTETGAPIAIGYVRLSLSSASIRKEVRQIILANILIAAAITAFAIVLITVLVRRLVVRPVLDLRHDVTAFKTGSLSDTRTLSASAPYELRDLEREFHDLYRSIRDKEQRLIGSEQRIRDLFDRVEHAIFRLDAKGAIIDANARFRNLFGPATLFCEIIAGNTSANECLAMAASRTVQHREERAADKDGNELIVSISLYPEHGPDGAVTGFDGYLIDITERMRFQERLMRAQKLEAVGTLAGGMAHDFNNLLTAILGYSGIILKTTTEGDPCHKPASIIHEAATRGAEFGKKILSITRKGRMETRLLDLNDIVNSSLELLHRSMPKDIEIVTNFLDGLPMVSADPSQIQQVVINLAVNARDAMPSGGKLLIETRTAASAEGAAANAEGGGFVQLSVSDTGTGIDSESQAKIFDPFYTTKDVGKGTGLGLYIVHSIVNNHGGYINLYSEPGTGTRFNIYLPAAKGDLRKPVEPHHDITGSGTILVIDDEPHVRELCKDMLTALGYTVFLAESGSVGLGLFREKRNEIVLVILDMVMPKMGGTEVFHALRTIDPQVRILLYSGYSHNNFAGINDLLKQGAIGFIQKPFSSEEIGLAIKKALLPASSSPP